MTVTRRRAIAVLSAVVLVSGTTVSLASTPAVPRILERNLTHTSQFSSGEPEIAVNPKNPNNMVYVATHYRLVRMNVGGQQVEVPYTVASFGEVFGITDCTVLYTFDRGVHWYTAPWPNGQRPYCGDPMVAVDRNGTFYVTFDWMGSEVTPVVPPSSSDTNGFAYSTDGGRSWSEPISTGVTTDRPFFRVDSSTGKLYEEGGLSNRTLAVSSGLDPRHAAKGVTFRAPVPFPGDHVAVHDGLLATALQASSGGPTVQLFGSNAAGGGSTELTFYLSRDDGRHFTSAPVRLGNGKTVSGGTGDWISADPTHPGRFAVMQQTADGYEVYVTDDAGHSWRGPARIAAPQASKPWMDFGSTGLLGVMWKSAKLDVYSVVSADHGRTFSRAVKVNSHAQNPNANVEGDDLSWILLDDAFAYVGWGDTSTGYCNGFFARVPLAAYSHR